jgi:hypothetical protein
VAEQCTVTVDLAAVPQILLPLLAIPFHTELRDSRDNQDGKCDILPGPGFTRHLSRLYPKDVGICTSAINANVDESTVESEAVVVDGGGYKYVLQNLRYG